MHPPQTPNPPANEPWGANQEVLPALVTVLAQPQRTVARHLLAPEELAARARLVDTMLDYGVSFALSGPDALAAQGASDVVLSPPVHRVALFEVRAIPPRAETCRPARVGL